MSVDTAQQALGFLITSAICHVMDGTGFAIADEAGLPPEKAVGCCRECCFTCAALAWYAQHAPEAASDAVVASMPPGTHPWSWQTFAYEIDWAQVRAAWDAYVCDGYQDHEGGA